MEMVFSILQMESRAPEDAESRFSHPMEKGRQGAAAGPTGVTPLSTLAHLAWLNWQQGVHAGWLNHHKQHRLSFNHYHFKDYHSQLFQLIKP